MNEKKLKEIAEKIFEAEKILQSNVSEEEKTRAKETILLMSKKITSLEDIMILDEIIQKKFRKKLTLK